MGKITVEKNVGGIQGLCIIQPSVYGDDRGYFMETYNQRDMQEAGLDMVFVQDNQSCSVKGVLRGLHFQKEFPQGKLVRVVKRLVWNNANGCEQYILHEKDISYASNRLNSHHLNLIPSCYHIFQKGKNVILLYNELSKLFAKSDLVTMGVGLDKNILYSCYGEMNLNNQLTIAMLIVK